MKTGFFLTARLGSRRLPRKHLLEAGGMALVALLAARITRSFTSEIASGQAVVAIVTSEETENREFERFTPMGIRIFYGATENIPLRHLQAAHDMSVDAIIAVDGDDILCSPVAMRAVRERLAGGAEYAKTSGLPLGMNSFGYRRDFLAAAVAGNERKTLETGWGHIFDASRLADLPMDLGLGAPANLRFTLDYPEDYAFFKAIAGHLGDRMLTAGNAEIVSCVLEHGLQKLTDPVAEKYWENFRSVQAEEMRRG